MQDPGYKGTQVLLMSQQSHLNPSDGWDTEMSQELDVGTLCCSTWEVMFLSIPLHTALPSWLSLPLLEGLKSLGWRGSLEVVWSNL